jgi:hypothetical protein
VVGCGAVVRREARTGKAAGYIPRYRIWSMNSISLAILIGGMILSPAIAYLLKGRLQTEGAVVLGVAIAAACFGAAVLISANACSVDHGNISQCPSARLSAFFIITGSAGLTCAGVLALLLYRTPEERWGRRFLLLMATLRVIPTFLPAIFSIGAVLILAYWALLGWLIIKDPPLRLDEVDRVG